MIKKIFLLLLFVFLISNINIETVSANGNATANETLNQTLNYSCTIGNNFSTIPKGINLTMKQNTTTTFSFFSLLLGDCSLNLSYSGCKICLYSYQNWQQEYGSNIQVDVQVTLPEMMTNETNQTYSYLIDFDAVPPTNQTNFLLNVFVPFEETNISRPANITQNITTTNITKQGITDFIYSLDKEDQLFVALVINDLFNTYNFSFIKTIVQNKIVEIPVYSQIPINMEEYKKFIDSASKVNQFVLLLQDKDDKYAEALKVANERDQRNGELLQDIQRLETDVAVIKKERDMKISELQETSTMWMYTAFTALPILLVIFGVWRLKERGRIWKPKDFTPPKKIDPSSLKRRIFKENTPKKTTEKSTEDNESIQEKIKKIINSDGEKQ